METTDHPPSRWYSRVPWPLLAILAVQTLFSLRWIRSGAIFSDEALYLYAGHQMIGHWIHGTIVQDYPLYFSGSPALYPPIGAIADHFGGLAGARTLGLFFMLGATTLVYASTARLFNRTSGAFGALLFASLAGTQFLSAFATYDPMALFLLALSAYLVIRYGGEEGLRGVVLSMLIAPLILALANATKYASALWDPIVIALAVCMPGESTGASWRIGFQRGARFTAVLALILGGALFGIGHGKYVTGILNTTVNRSAQQISNDPAPAKVVLLLAWAWIGAVIILAIASPIFQYGSADYWWKRPLVAVLAILAAATLLAPLNQARIGTATSLQKHVVFGAWFGCIAAGYTAAWIAKWLAPRRWHGVRLSTLAAMFAASLIALPNAYASQVAPLRQWGTENPMFVHALSALTHPGGERYLIENPDAFPAYYVGSVTSLQWKENSGDRYRYTDPSGQVFSGTAGYAAAIRNKAFSLIILNNTSPDDPAIEADIRKYGGYHATATLPPSTLDSTARYTVWALNTKGH